MRETKYNISVTVYLNTTKTILTNVRNENQLKADCETARANFATQLLTRFDITIY